MREYTIYTDSACDIGAETLAEWGVKSLSLRFHFTDDEKEIADGAMPHKEFYDEMRAGRTAKTAAVNAEEFKNVFEEELKAGRDVLYIGFSSGLSATYNSGRIAAEELQEEYPDMVVTSVDSLAASAGFGLLIYFAAQMKKEGKSLEEVKQFILDKRLNLCHFFTVDDLVYLKRGGRISAATALFGGMLGIKPVMHVDNEGHLVPLAKVRGRKAALKALADKIGEEALEQGGGTVFISHGDCWDDVAILEDMMAKAYGTKVALAVNVGTVIGAHSGPGTMALFFLGKER